MAAEDCNSEVSVCFLILFGVFKVLWQVFELDESSGAFFEVLGVVSSDSQQGIYFAGF